MMQDQLPAIAALLQDKAALKQGIFQSTLAVFQHLRTQAEALAASLTEIFAKSNPDLQVSFQEISAFEFHLKMAGDVLLVQMHTDVQTFPGEHLINKSRYVQEDPRRGYFGAITVYNFMADSLKYSRLNDAGYLLARMMVNGEGHYYIEGVRELNFLHPDLEANVVDEDILRDFLQSTIILAVEIDLVAPPYQEIQIMALGDKLQDQMAGAAKVGFQIKPSAK